MRPSIAPPLPQLRVHDPCGHWHKGEAGRDTAQAMPDYAANCWESCVATDGASILYVTCGKHRPNELYLLRYNIATNVWSELASDKDMLCSNWQVGASVSGNIYAFHGFVYDITGEQFQEQTSNPRTVTWVVHNSTSHQKDWPGTVEFNGRNRVAVASSGLVACMIRTATDWQVHRSIDYGDSYALLYSVPIPVTEAALVISGSTIYTAVIDGPGNKLRIYGASAALLSTTDIESNPTSLRFHFDNGRFIVAAGDHFYYSTDNCSSFTSKELKESNINFASTDTLYYNVGHEQDYRTTNYEVFEINWEEIGQFGTTPDGCCLNNYGQTAVYSHPSIRTENISGREAVAILLSQNLGSRWQSVATPLAYYETFEDTLHLGDDPRWPFVPQYTKI